MTIIAGFRCHEGVVICGDTQETLGSAKRNVQKVRVEAKYPRYIPRMDGTNGDLFAAFCGSGNGPFIDMLIDRAWKAAKDTETLDAASGVVEEEIKHIYKEMGEIYQIGQCPSVEIIYGIRAGGESRLFLASGPVVVEKLEYESSGIGSDIANYLTSRMYGSSLNLYQCSILAAYILLQAKNHVEGCGGKSHIAVLRNSGECGLIEPRRVESLTTLLESADISVGRLLLRTADVGLSDEIFHRAVNEYVKSVEYPRQVAIQAIKQSDDAHNFIMSIVSGSETKIERDNFGFDKDTEEESESMNN